MGGTGVWSWRDAEMIARSLERVGSLVRRATTARLTQSCALLFALATLATLFSSPSGALATSNATPFGRAELAVPPAWSRNGLAWAWWQEFGGGAVLVRPKTSDTTVRLAITPPSARDRQVAWMDGRVYWVRLEMDAASTRVVHESIMSQRLGEDEATTLLTRGRIGSFCVKKGRVAWVQRQRNSRAWEVCTMRLGSRPVSVARTGTTKPDLVLTEHLLAWATSGEWAVHVYEAGQADGLGARRSVTSGDRSPGGYCRGTLVGDGRRLAWLYGSEEESQYVASWKLGDCAPARIGLAFDEDANHYVSDPRVTVFGKRVAWLQTDVTSTAVCVWQEGTSLVSRLAEYNPEQVDVSNVDASGLRIAWWAETSEAATPTSAAPGPLTWAVGDVGPRAVERSKASRYVWVPNARVVGDEVAYIGARTDDGPDMLFVGAAGETVADPHGDEAESPSSGDSAETQSKPAPSGWAASLSVDRRAKWSLAVVAVAAIALALILGLRSRRT
jgi:hypothetical protein